MSQSKHLSSLSPEKRALVLDLLQSKQDPAYFINDHCWISHPMKGRIRFNTYEFQDEALSDFEDHRFNVVLKSRQMGISTLIAAYGLQKTQFNENKKILIIATKQEVARNIIEHYKFMYNNLEDHLKVPTTEMNKLTVRHTNGSFIKATSSSGDAGRSEAISLLIIDEAAFIANIDDIWTSAQATISTGGRVIILSTPNGQGGFFHKICMGAMEGTNGFNLINIPWYRHPDRDQEWRDLQTRQLGEKKAAQECDCETFDSIVTLKCEETNTIIRIPIGDAYLMMKSVGVSDTIRFNTKWSILTPNGFESFSGIQKTYRDEHIQIVLSNGKILSTSTGHKLVMDDGELVESININNGDVIKGNGKDVIVVNTSLIQQPTDLYSILDSGEDHLYISQGVVSHNCDFSTSGDGVIAITKLDEMKERNVIPPIEKQGQKDELWIWKEPEEESVYMCIADVARGDGEDFSGCIVFNIDTLEQVAEYKGLIGAKEYGSVLINLATRYNDAVLVIENTGVGWATIQAVVDREYKNLFYSYRGSEDAYVDINVQRAKKNYSNIDKKNMVPGFSMSAKVRPHIIEKMEQFIRDDEVIIRSERLINELKTFVWLNGKAQAMRGYHDDLVMPLCTAIWIRETALRMKNVGRKYSKKMLEAINTNIPQDNTSRINDPYYMEVNSVDKQDNDMRWLFSAKDKQADNIHKQHRPPPNNPSNKPPGIYLGSG